MKLGGKIRVMQLGTSGPLYGAERWIMALVKNLSPHMVESHVAAIDDDAASTLPILEAARDAGFPVMKIGTPNSGFLSMVKSLKAQILVHQIDIVHSHGYKADLAALLACRGTRAKTVSTPHGWSRNAGWKLKLYEWMDRQIFRFFDAVVPLSEDLLTGLSRGLQESDRMHLICNGVDIAEVDETLPATQQASNASRLKIGYIGQLITRKGVDTLLRAFARANLPNSQLILVGEGDERTRLEALAAELGIGDRTVFTGFRADRIALLKTFDLFVLPSREEGIPRCLMEAMVAGIAVIASDIPGNRDLVTDGKTGRLFTPGNAQQLSDLFTRYAKGQEADTMRQSARQKIDREYSAQRMAQQYQELFQQLTAK